MIASRGLLSACALWAAACSGQREPFLTSAATPGDTVIFAVDLWPGEGIPVIELQRTSVPIREQPDPLSPVADTLRGRVGQRVAFDSTRYQTIATGSMDVSRPFQLTGRAFGNVKHLTLEQYYQSLPEVTVGLAAATTIDVLQYRAEGTCFVRVEQRVIDAQPCPGLGRERVTVTREPVTRWWVLTRGSTGMQGWLFLSDTTARAVRREF